MKFQHVLLAIALIFFTACGDSSSGSSSDSQISDAMKDGKTYVNFDANPVNDFYTYEQIAIANSKLVPGYYRYNTTSKNFEEQPSFGLPGFLRYPKFYLSDGAWKEVSTQKLKDGKMQNEYLQISVENATKLTGVQPLWRWNGEKNIFNDIDFSKGGKDYYKYNLNVKTKTGTFLYDNNITVGTDLAAYVKNHCSTKDNAWFKHDEVSDTNSTVLFFSFSDCDKQEGKLHVKVSSPVETAKVGSWKIEDNMIKIEDDIGKYGKFSTLKSKQIPIYAVKDGSIKGGERYTKPIEKSNSNVYYSQNTIDLFKERVKKEVGKTMTTAIIVDPYIEGAILYEDKNKDGKHDSDEQESTPSNAQGKFTFSKKLTPGSIIRIKKQGTHVGKTYDLDITAVVGDDKTLKIVSPLTTFQAKKINNQEIANIFAGIGISGEDVLKDPMGNGLKDKTTFDGNDIKKLQASLASYGLLKVMNGSEALKKLSGSELANSAEFKSIADAMGGYIKDALSKERLTEIQNSLPSLSGPVSIPYVKGNVIINTATKVMDKLATIGYEACNASGGNATKGIEAASNAKDKIMEKIGDIGQYYYGMENKNDNTLKSPMAQPYLPEYVKKGMEATKDCLKIKEEGANDYKVTTGCPK